jgi:GTP cyclohydrolase I
MYPVSQAELFGVELRRRCGPCILWIISILAVGYIGSQVVDGISTVGDIASARASKAQAE